MKPLLYLKDSYCPNVDTLKEMLKKHCLESGFREEVLTCYEDGNLKNWLEELGSQVVLPEKGLSDTECFKGIYETIVGEVCKIGFMSSLYDYAEFKVLMDDGNFVEPKGDNPVIYLFNGDLLLRFKSVGSGRETFKLSLKDDWTNFIINTQEIVLGSNVDIDVVFRVTTPGMYALYEGDNLLCSVSYCEKKEVFGNDGYSRLMLFPFYENGQRKYMTQIVTRRDQSGRMVRYKIKGTSYNIDEQSVNFMYIKLNEAYEFYRFDIPTENELKYAFKNKSIGEFPSSHYRMAVCETRNVSYECPKFTFKLTEDENAVNAVCFLATEIPQEEWIKITGADESTLKIYPLSDGNNDEYLTEIIIPGLSFESRASRRAVETLNKYVDNFSGWQFELLSNEYYEFYKNKLPFKKQWEDYNVIFKNWGRSEEKNSLVFLVRKKKD